MLGSLPGEERDLKGGQENQIIKKKKKLNQEIWGMKENI